MRYLASFRVRFRWDQAAATYALDPDMAATLRKNNPQVRLSACGTSPFGLQPHTDAVLGVSAEMLLSTCLVPVGTLYCVAVFRSIHSIRCSLSAWCKHQDMHRIYMAMRLVYY